jgi:hypothetical protein
MVTLYWGLLRQRFVGLGEQGTLPEVNVTGNYVVTLEARQGHQGKEFSYARIYANWNTTHTTQQPMRARIAGRVTPSSTQGGPPSLEMIELPLKKNPNIVACCQVSKHSNLTMKYAGKNKWNCYVEYSWRHGAEPGQL